MAMDFKRFLSWRWLAVPAVLAALCVVACGGQPLEPHAGVDGRLRQRHQFTVRLPVESR